jgi:hypothetical protein
MRRTTLRTQDMLTQLQLRPLPHCPVASAIPLLIPFRQGMPGKEITMPRYLRQHPSGYRRLPRKIMMMIRSRSEIHTTDVEVLPPPVSTAPGTCVAGCSHEDREVLCNARAVVVNIEIIHLGFKAQVHGGCLRLILLLARMHFASSLGFPTTVDHTQSSRHN